MGKALGKWMVIAAACVFQAVSVCAEDQSAVDSSGLSPSKHVLTDLADVDLACFACETQAEGVCDLPLAGACCKPGLIGYVDWLNWKARRRGMDFASFLNPVWLTPVSTESLDYGRDDGLRVGLGWQFGTCWDVSWNYTYFHTDDSGSALTTDQPSLAMIATRSLIDTTFETVWADAELDYDVNDLEAGRWFTLDERLSMRVFGGFRWAIIDQELRLNHTYRNIANQSITGNIENPTNMDGYGIRVGTEGRWKSGTGLSLFARGAGAVLVGKFDTRLVEVDETYGTIMNYSDSYTQAVPNIEAAAGVAWNRGPLELSGGYELNAWFNMAEVDRNSYDLMLDGFFLRLALVR